MVFSFQEHVVHGDIRRSNIRFALDGKTTIIDWELAGSTSYNCTYPSNYSDALPERHQNAKAGSTMYCIHDQFSAVKILSQYAPINDNFIEKWDNAVNAMVEFLVNLGPNSGNYNSVLEAAADARLRSSSPFNFWETVKGSEFCRKEE
eukprot:Plantae.Rhodophyta-Palmaria_palmata.ctg28198.p2 GENE.Plantae.Rhodophyta-Palmaria_palmata.ctg28198~~Plantae.Rhodophyta-Palmaria_palmata.ctg28198.p2  ORF type:complete len:168 (-),score=17.45 Plantae.Rhodophyta-Palmaria_palmata.ctg28198:88-531(-)